MPSEMDIAQQQANCARYQPGQTVGHYESFFLRANHPTRPLAFWIRYTIFSPQQRPEQAVGELWAVYFHAEAGAHVAVKTELPISQCAFSTTGFSVRIGDAELRPGRFHGSAAIPEHAITWDLAFRGNAAPLFLLPLNLYRARIPRAKSLVGLPFAVFAGKLTVDGEAINVTDWVGSQNHNWGSQHTDHYAWGQVAGFDTHPDSFLEVATARLKLGPVWTPFMTTLVLRHRGEEIRLNNWRQMLRAKGSFRYFEWQFSSQNDAMRIDGTISAPRDAFVGLRYANPPGGFKHCLNSKLAACELRVTHLQNRPAAEMLSTRHRAAFEILTDDQDHGIAIRV